MVHDDDDANVSAANGNRYLAFTELMRLDKVGDGGAFKSTAKAFSPGDTTAAYGGHVYAQAVWAASQTVRRGFVVNNVTGFFIFPGDTTRPFIYHVRNLRDGGRYCTRSVDVVQDPQRGVCFTCTCIFKVDEEPGDYDFQEPCDLAQKYGSALGDRRPEDWSEAPSVDSPWYWELAAAKDGPRDAFPGLSLRKVDMAPYNQDHRGPLERRQLQFYSTTGEMPPVTEEPNLHACAHLYACDRNSLFLIPNHLDVGDDYRQMASLSYSVVFHVSSKEMAMQVKEGEKRWFCQEARISRTGGNRGLHVSRLWSPDGRHIATTWQDGLVRIGKPSRWTAKIEGLKKAKL
ncbi:thioesterase-like superfamily-domain-containing protein [Phyllosticta capitalensis]|uniref:Thioesterase-like superfamily-domain-containing protein n=1 Tax=Phyllosticta capitalensis TaxID=121624 RepID=A0ABR1YLG7_9PEZI